MRNPKKQHKTVVIGLTKHIKINKGIFQSYYHALVTDYTTNLSLEWNVHITLLSVRRRCRYLTLFDT